MKELYRIRRRSDGMFSLGGMFPTFGKKGKVWTGSGPLLNHLRLVDDYGPHARAQYTDCELVKYRVVETEVSTEGLGNYLQDLANQKLAKEQARRDRAARAKEAEELAEYQRLSAKFGKTP